jgi:hypothetical protein
MIRGLKATLKVAVCGTGASLGAFFFATRKNVFVPLEPTDAIFHHHLLRKLNPSSNPTMHDICVRRIPISDIRPELLDKEEGLVEAFCAGVWSGWGESWVFSRLPLKLTSIHRIQGATRHLSKDIPRRLDAISAVVS